MMERSKGRGGPSRGGPSCATRLFGLSSGGYLGLTVSLPKLSGSGKGRIFTHQEHLPEQEQHLLHGEVGSVATAELGHHREEQKSKRLLGAHGEPWQGEGPGVGLEPHPRGLPTELGQQKDLDGASMTPEAHPAPS